MAKKEGYGQDLAALLGQFLQNGDAQALRDYLAVHSNLPGPRGNLELAAAWADALAGYPPTARERLWGLCSEMAALPAGEAPVGDPREFVAFCGALGLGALGAAWPELTGQALAALHRLADDPRWRLREAVAMALQRLLQHWPSETWAALEGWSAEASPLPMRAAAAAVAEPPLLGSTETARRALELHRTLFARLPGIPDRKSEAFKTLRQGLGYTLSVVVAALPGEGFLFMEELARSGDPDVRWIVRENLKKNRLVRQYPAEVERVKRDLEGWKVGRLED
jgi:hypothetical protein